MDNDWNLLRQYVGARFCHGGRDVKYGIDCLGLLICFYEAKFGRFPIPLPRYAKSSNLHPHREINLRVLDQVFQKDHVQSDEKVRLAVLKLARYHYHLTFLTSDHQGFKHIHATSANGVIEERFHPSWHNKIISAYRLEKR